MTTKTRNRKSCTVGVAVTQREKAIFTTWCKQRDCTPSRMLRSLIHELCNDVAAQSNQPRPPMTMRMEMRWMPEELRTLEAWAASEKCTPQEVVRKVIRIRLYKCPTFNPLELRTVLESNRQVAALGRNINQIARHLNENRSWPASVHASELMQLRAKLNEHIEHVREMILINFLRFGGVES